jgi:hypothetical protein
MINPFGGAFPIADRGSRIDSLPAPTWAEWAGGIRNPRSAIRDRFSYAFA